MRIHPIQAIKDHRILIVAAGILLLMALMPVSVARYNQEENPDDSSAILVSQSNEATFSITTDNASTHAISVFTGDTVRAPLHTKITVRISNDANIRTYVLQDILHAQRKLLIPLQVASSAPISITIGAPTLSSSTPLLLRTQQRNPNELAYTAYVQRPAIVVIVHKLYGQPATASDIQYVWQEGKTILEGKNPYEKGRSSEYGGQKFATYFPLSYIISAGIQKMGLASFSSWMSVVQPIILISQFISALLVLWYCYKKDKLMVGIFGFLLILFHRFTLYPARVSHIDFPAIALLIAGIMLLPKRTRTAYVLIGISLATKQMAIFLLPIFLVWAWQKDRSLPKILKALTLMLAVSFISIAPFILTSPLGTINSIIFSAHRPATGDFASPDISAMLEIDGFAARIPMLVLFALVYAAFWKREIGLWGACLAIFTIFIGFNPVLFFQYLAWIIPLIPLAISEAALSEFRSQLSRQLRDT